VKNTNIQWADDTVNPTSGCDGCELWVKGKGGPCYAGNFHETRLAQSLPTLYDPVFTNVREIPGRMAKAVRCMDLTGKDRPTKPWLNGLRRKIFAGDLGDIFSNGISLEFLKEEIIDIALSPNGARHDLLLLTKQPHAAWRFSVWLKNHHGIEWPDNVWIGTSVTSASTKSRLKSLRAIPAKHRFLSMEPVYGDPKLTTKDIDGIDWMIIGGESDQGVHQGRIFQVDWARDIIELGVKTDTAVFVKQMGSQPIDSGMNLILKDHHGGDWSEWPDDVKVRQMPPE
jgi:protein gp37